VPSRHALRDYPVTEVLVSDDTGRPASPERSKSAAFCPFRKANDRSKRCVETAVLVEGAVVSTSAPAGRPRR
jgi:hypothetical protein